MEKCTVPIVVNYKGDSQNLIIFLTAPQIHSYLDPDAKIKIQIKLDRKPTEVYCPLGFGSGFS
jgi:hypothetical protein